MAILINEAIFTLEQFLWLQEVSWRLINYKFIQVSKIRKKSINSSDFFSALILFAIKMSINSKKKVVLQIISQDLSPYHTKQMFLLIFLFKAQRKCK